MAIDAFSLQIFRDEALEHLAALEHALLALDPAAPDPELVDGAFRSLHTIKGSGAMFGLDHLVEFSHLAESLFSRLRDGSLTLNQELIDLGLRAKDFLFLLLPGSEATETDLGASLDLRAAISALLPAVTTLGQPPVSTTAAVRSWSIRFKPGENLFKSGTNPLQLLKEAGDLGQIQIIGHTDRIPPLEEMDPEACYLGWELLLRTDRPERELRDIFIFVEGDSELDYRALDEGIPGPDDLDTDRLAERLKASRDPRARRERDSGSTIKVSTLKLDAMVNLAGELVTLQSRYLQLAEECHDPELRTLNENLETLTRNLRGLAMEMHMVPLELLFSSFQRLVRDLGRRLGKQVVLEISGADTELEKNIIEELKDPLLHLIRNAMDHGIEPPGIRLGCGKDPTGRLRLSARHEGSTVVIRVEDDGIGLDTRAILRKALERQLIASGHGLSERDIHQLIFLPGFSTAATISDVSGRGVGMDVVKSSIENLRGSIRLESRPGEGTRVELRLPLSLTVIEALLLRIDGTPYAINLGIIKECRERQTLQTLKQGTMVVYQDQPVPCIDLGSFYDPLRPPRAEGIVVFVSEGGRTVGLLVDEVRNTIQAVIKPLGKSFAGTRGVNGAVVLGDGSLALVVDAGHFLAMQAGGI